MWLNACSSSPSVASGILSVAALSTFIGLPVSISLGAISLAGVSISGVAMAPAKKYQKKLAKVTMLTDIVTLALAIFKMSVSKVLNNYKIDELEFGMLQTSCLEALNDLSNVDHKMEAKMIAQLRKSLLEEINDLKKAVRGAS